MLALLVPGVGMGGGVGITLIGVWADPIECQSSSTRLEVVGGASRIECVGNSRIET